MNPLEQAIHLNNEAAMLLQSGRVVDAAHLLQRALVILKNSEFSPEAAEEEQVPIQAMAATEWASSANNAGEKKREWHDQDGLIYIYDQPLFLPSKFNVATPEGSTRILHTVSMHAIFNLALAYHLHGRITGAEMPSTRAIELYYMVLSSYDFDSTSGGIVVKSSKAMGHALWQCLVLNNLAHLHHELCEYEHSQYCMECIADILSRTDCFAKAGDILNDNEMSAFALNRLTLNHFPTAAKAA